LAAAVAIGCGTTGHVPQPFPTPGGGGAATGTSIPPSRTTTPSTLVDTALKLRGVPYRKGGNDPGGFDCSGFTQYVFAQFNVELPRETRDQFKLGQPIRLAEVAPGDLLFFTTTAPGASHVGIAIGSGEFVHAPTSDGVVRVDQVSASYWSVRYVGARRITLP
jgi:cell wall-associated NlpC family hydrolase